jgi:hypothetical protein
MKNRATVLSFAIALALAPFVAASAAPTELAATGTVVSKKADALVVRTDDHRHRITFDVDRSTALPDGLAVGRRVRIVYRPNGSTGQTAEKVTLLEASASKRPGS